MPKKRLDEVMQEVLRDMNHEQVTRFADELDRVLPEAIQKTADQIKGVPRNIQTPEVSRTEEH